jgi:hypothetical protein
LATTSNLQICQWLSSKFGQFHNRPLIELKHILDQQLGSPQSTVTCRGDIKYEVEFFISARSSSLQACRSLFPLLSVIDVIVCPVSVAYARNSIYLGIPSSLPAIHCARFVHMMESPLKVKQLFK